MNAVVSSEVCGYEKYETAEKIILRDEWLSCIDLCQNPPPPPPLSSFILRHSTGKSKWVFLSFLFSCLRARINRWRLSISRIWFFFSGGGKGGGFAVYISLKGKEMGQDFQPTTKRKKRNHFSF